MRELAKPITDLWKPFKFLILFMLSPVRGIKMNEFISRLRLAIKCFTTDKYAFVKLDGFTDAEAVKIAKIMDAAITAYINKTGDGLND